MPDPFYGSTYLKFMPDLTYILTTIGFFALMILFAWGCDKV